MGGRIGLKANDGGWVEAVRFDVDAGGKETREGPDEKDVVCILVLGAAVTSLIPESERTDWGGGVGRFIGATTALSAE